METQKTTEKLSALFKLAMGDIGAALEKPAQTYFGGSANLLDDNEITDLSLELRYLISGLIGAADPFSRSSPEFRALESFFTNLARKVLTRGGKVDDIVRYTQNLQETLIRALEQDSGIEFTRSRSVLHYFSNIFIELILAVFRAYLDQKDETIRTQESELRETSTPITEIWDGVLTLPIIGTLDSSRTMILMESLLNRISIEHTKVVVMDLTGVNSIDSQVSHHLIQMVRAVQLMGSDAILTGIRPEIARALTSLNIDLGDIVTRGSLSDGLKAAFKMLGIQVSPATAH
ncbi:MAG: STAS domain-containing protein [Chromatiales bacterium]|nr:STAS domain-containing protein [Chromatiales bacterium]